jgi:hypothetical protein
MNSAPNKLNLLKEQLNNLSSPKACWETVDSNNNGLVFIPRDISNFIPIENGNLLENAENYFTPLAMLCIWKPQDFGKLLEAFGEHREEFLSSVLRHNNNSLSPFETTLILGPLTTCCELRKIYEPYSVDLKNSCQPGKALDTCVELNKLLSSGHLDQIQERFKRYKKPTTKRDICNHINDFPLWYHPHIINFVHVAFNISIGELEAEIGNKSAACTRYFDQLRIDAIRSEAQQESGDCVLF